jgi:hypothetical protein
MTLLGDVAAEGRHAGAKLKISLLECLGRC